MKTMKLLALLLVALLLGGCPVVDSQIESGAREYFPKAIVHHPHPTIVHVETCVGNVTRKFGEKVFLQIAQGREGRDLLTGMQAAGYRFFILGFDDFNVVWDTRTGQAMFMDETNAAAWWFQHFGSTPISPAPRRCD